MCTCYQYVMMLLVASSLSHFSALFIINVCIVSTTSYSSAATDIIIQHDALQSDEWEDLRILDGYRHKLVIIHCFLCN